MVDACRSKVYVYFVEIKVIFGVFGLKLMILGLHVPRFIH
jgi:hypothetical protein